MKRCGRLGCLFSARCCRSRTPALGRLWRVAARPARWALMRWRSPLRVDCTALLGPGSRRRTHCAHFVRCVQTAAASQMTRRAGARRPRPCAARRHPNRAQRSSLAAKSTGFGVRCQHLRRVCKVGFGQAAARLWSAEKRRACGRARSALRHLTRRGCLNGMSAANAVSSATGPRDRASQGSRRAATTAPAKRGGLSGPRFAAQTVVHKAGDQGPHRAASRHTLATQDVEFHFSRRRAVIFDQAATTGILTPPDLMRASHSLGPVSWTDTPWESTATVTGMSVTSNS